MIKFIGTPMFDNCLRDLRLADLEESLVMCSPYIKKEAVRKFFFEGAAGRKCIRADTYPRKAGRLFERQFRH